MKAVFPCPGTIILIKNDIEKIQGFYNANLMTSKMYEYSKNSNLMIQVGDFNYVPNNYSLILENSNLLSLNSLKRILDSSNKNKNTDDSVISDYTIESHPFFKTLKPIN